MIRWSTNYRVIREVVNGGSSLPDGGLVILPVTGPAQYRHVTVAGCVTSSSPAFEGIKEKTEQYIFKYNPPGTSAKIAENDERAENNRVRGI
jgi:hypothetical protein